MPSFKDTAGREWSLAIDVFLLEQVETRTGVRIDTLLENEAKGLSELFGHPTLFVRVLWVLIEDECKRIGVAPEQFGRAMNGETLDEASGAFMGAFALFCPSRQRAIVEALTAKSKEVSALASKVMLKAIEGLDPSACLTSSPASSASTPPAAA